jgi:hypothetical protein
MYTGMVSFDTTTGNHIRRASYYWSQGVDKRSNFIFKDRLQLVETRLGGAIFVSANTGKRYTAFISDLIKFTPLMTNGIVEGFFTFRGNGGSTGVIPTTFAFEDYTVKAEDTSPKVLRGQVSLSALSPRY